MSTDRAPLGRPLLLVNLKSFPEAVGPGALRIGRKLSELGRSQGQSVAIAPAPQDVGLLAKELRIPVLAQHADLVGTGQVTGYVSPEALRLGGARGSLLNHSEHPLPIGLLRSLNRRLARLELVAVICARDVANARALAHLRPPYLAVEPPELIGGTLSVSTARPEVVANSVVAVRSVSKQTTVLCGAGVHDRHDVRKALDLGSEGVLVASAVARARSPSAAIRELLAGFR